MGREIIVGVLVTGPFGVLANDLTPQLVRDPQAFDRAQSEEGENGLALSPISKDAVS